MNKKIAVMAASAVLLVGMLTLTGCKPPSPATIKKGLTIAGQSGSAFGLRKWAEKDAPSAKECAAALKANIDNDLLPYLNGGNLPSSDQIQAFIQSSLFKNVKPEVKDAIILASVALDNALPIPAAGTYLKQDQVDYIKAFLSGISAGCADFLGTREIGPAAPKTNWVK